MKPLCVLQKTYEEMGHIFSPSKTFLIPLSSEFIQTFARFGLYIFRDQIPLIASEKPRDIRNAVGFLSSFKSILLAKLARGMNPDYAYMLYYLHLRKITEMTLKRHDCQCKSDKQKEVSIPGCPNIRAKVLDLNYTRNSNRPTQRREEVRVFRFSTMIAYLPICAGGGALNPLLMGLVHTPAFFLQFLSTYPRDFQEMMYGAYIFMANRPLNNGETEESGKRTGKDRVKLTKDFTPFSVEQLFSLPVRKGLDALKDVKIGRMAAENVPKQIMMNGIMMEKCMHVETNFIREEYAEEFLNGMHRELRNIKTHNDEWLLNFKYILRTEPTMAKDQLFWVGLNDEEYEMLLRVYGLSTLGSRINNMIDKLRLIISRDPVLRTDRTPDEVISVLDDFGVSTHGDRELGLLILFRMGFEQNVAHAIMDVRLSVSNDMILDQTYGMFSDDFLAALNIRGRG